MDEEIISQMPDRLDSILKSFEVLKESKKVSDHQMAAVEESLRQMMAMMVSTSRSTEKYQERQELRNENIDKYQKRQDVRIKDTEAYQANQIEAQKKAVTEFDDIQRDIAGREGDPVATT